MLRKSLYIIQIMCVVSTLNGMEKKPFDSELLTEARKLIENKETSLDSLQEMQKRLVIEQRNHTENDQKKDQFLENLDHIVRQYEEKLEKQPPIAVQVTPGVSHYNKIPYSSSSFLASIHTSPAPQRLIPKQLFMHETTTSEGPLKISSALEGLPRFNAPEKKSHKINVGKLIKILCITGGLIALVIYVSSQKNNPQHPIQA